MTIFTAESNHELFSQIETIFDIITKHFNSTAKAILWMTTNNPMMGSFSPLDLILLGRGQRILDFIENAKSGK